MTFKEYLVYRDIPYKENYDGTFQVKDEDLIPYELEYRTLVPEGELWSDYLRYRNEPGRRSMDC